MSIKKDLEWSPGWQKNDAYSQNVTADLIDDAMGKDKAMFDAFREGNLIVNAGPHTKAGPGGGGDARLHISVRVRGEGGWHILLGEKGGKLKFLKTEKRSKSQI